MPGTEAASPLLIYMVKQVELAVRARLDEIVRPAGLTALQYTALSVLERHTDMSSAQLARSSFVTAQSMADMITALEGRKLIERHRDRTDRRRLGGGVARVGAAPARPRPPRGRRPGGHHAQRAVRAAGQGAAGDASGLLRQRFARQPLPGVA